jgi:hypothetical protein
MPAVIAAHILAADRCLGLLVSAKLLLSRANPRFRRRQRSSDLSSAPRHRARLREHDEARVVPFKRG